MRTRNKWVSLPSGAAGFFNPLNAELNSICHFLALLGPLHILQVSRIRVNRYPMWEILVCDALEPVPFHIRHQIRCLRKSLRIQNFPTLNLGPETGCSIFVTSPIPLIWAPSKHINPLNAELNPICYLLALLGAHHFLHVSRIRVKSLTLRLLMSYTYGAPIFDVSRSHTTTQHSR